MRAKHLIIASLLALASGGATAQEAETVRGIVVAEHDSAWYAGQVAAWEREVRRHPGSEPAWRNLFRAARYLDERYDPAGQRMAGILARMKRKIPDSFTWHLCRYESWLAPEEREADLARCLELQPDNVEAFDNYLCHFWMKGDFERAYAYGRRYFESGCYSPALLQYSWNQLAGLPEGAIFVGNGDAELIPKIVLQGGKDVHRDKVVVPLSFLCLPEYVAALCGQLGVPVPQVSDSLSWNDRADAVVEHLIRTSGRPVYFAPSIGAERLRAFSQNLYSEGLVLRYSAVPYDNMAVMKRNVEQRYLLDGLRMSFVPQREWSAAAMMQLNYVVALQPLLRFYRESGDVAREAWLTGLLGSAIDGAACDEARKAPYRELLERK